MATPVEVLARNNINYHGHAILNVPGVIDRLDDFRDNFQAREDDVWLCGYMKTGTHWVNEVVHMLKTNSMERAPVKEQFFAELTSFREWDSEPSPRVMNTHLPFHLLPDPVRKSRIIVFVRNLKDVAVSMFNHFANMPQLKCFSRELNWEDFFEYFITHCQATEYYKQWTEMLGRFHNLNLLASRDENFVLPVKNVMLISYEEMKRDPLDHVIKIAQFLSYERDSDLYRDIVEKTDIKTMKAARGGEKFVLKSGQHSEGIELPVGLLYRKGIIGDWKNWFTVEQNKQFNSWYQEKIGDLKLGVEKYME